MYAFTLTTLYQYYCKSQLHEYTLYNFDIITWFYSHRNAHNLIHLYHDDNTNIFNHTWLMCINF